MQKPLLRFLLAAGILLFTTGPGLAADDAKSWFDTGLQAQQEHRTQEALQAYLKALELDPAFARAHYEIGWTYWVLADWPKVIEHWQTAQRLGFRDANLKLYLPMARDNLEGKLPPLTRTRIGEKSAALEPTGRLSLELVARFQHYNPQPENPADHYDPYIFSPKSVRFLGNGSAAYVNALEGYSTVVFDPVTLSRTAVIVHRFRDRQQHLFTGARGMSWYTMPAEFADRQQNFNGKPVESTLSHGGKYLWVPYYRRDFDPFGTLPSAVAVIDTSSNRIVRVMETGPIPKYVVASLDGNWLAVTHWGDNTVGLIDIHSQDPAEFKHQQLITIGKRIDLKAIQTNDRDHGCGFCLRGSVFTRDSKYLLVGRMGGGGIAVIEVDKRRYLGTVTGMRPTPRHLVLSPDGDLLYLSSSFAGYVAVYRTNDLVQAALTTRHLKPLREQHTGSATRTIALSSDGKLLFAAVNKESKIVALSAPGLTPLAEIPADSYPVGMAVSPDTRQLWVTAQGRKGRGGNSVSVFRIEAK